MTRTEYHNSQALIDLCKRNGLTKRIVRDLAWFMTKVNKDGPIPPKQPELGNCWEWTRAKNLHGYGWFAIGRQDQGRKWIEKRWMANRYSWFLHFGEIPDGLWVLHKCDNPPCVRPDHLFLGNNQQNQRDSHDKDRGYYKAGERHPRATISNDTARRVKEMLRDGVRTKDIIIALHVERGAVENIKYGNSFAWLTVPDQGIS